MPQGSKRLQKRISLGTEVSAPLSDGRFYNGVIESMTEQRNGQFMYSVLFDDGRSKLFYHKDIVGSGFSSISSVFLKHGQRVFTTLHDGREIIASVVKHNHTTNSLILETVDDKGEVVEFIKSIEHVRLLCSIPPHARDRQQTGISQGIDVPKATNRRRWALSSESGKYRPPTQLSCFPHFSFNLYILFCS